MNRPIFSFLVYFFSFSITFGQLVYQPQDIVESDKIFEDKGDHPASIVIDTGSVQVIPKSDSTTVISSFDEELLPCNHYHILYDECKIDSDMFTYTDAACDENPYLETMKADSLFWLEISPYYTSFNTKHVNPYVTKGTRMKHLKDTVSLLLYDTLSNDIEWSMPLRVNDDVTSGFKYRRYRWHKGTDLNLETGDSVFSVFDGVVRISGYNRGGYGHYVLVRHYNGLETIYGHLSKRYVCPGQPVKAGELLGLGGNTGRSTGSHLHFETRFRGVALDSEFLYDYKKQKLKTSEITLLPKFFTYVNGVAHYAPNGKTYHRIRSGDTLGAIAKRYRTYVSTLCKLNGIRSSTILRVGRNLRVR